MALDVVFMGSKSIGFQGLKFLLEHKTKLGINIVAVLTNPSQRLNKKEENIFVLVKEANIPIFTSLDEWSSEADCDYIISVQYHQILKQKHIDKARELAVNLHLAPLPEYRGCNPFSFAILDQRKEYGVTIHELTAGIDAGDILFESRFSIPDSCMVHELYDLAIAQAIDLFKTQIVFLFSKNYTAVSQESLVETRGSSYHFRSEIEQIKCIDLKWDWEQQLRHFRATFFPPFSPPYTLIADERISINSREELEALNKLST